MITTESLAEERRITVFTRGVFAVLEDGRILHCFRRDGPSLLPGDLVCLLKEAMVPCILRLVGGHFQYLGNCHILDGSPWRSQVDRSIVDEEKLGKPTIFHLV